MKPRVLLAELLGTFLLALMVRLSLDGGPIATPILAGLTLMFIVLVLGPISGAHVNPAVTIGLASIKKIEVKDAAWYVLAQLVGGAIALYIGTLITGHTTNLSVDGTTRVFLGEALGAAILLLGVTSVVLGKIPKEIAGISIGSSLTLGAVLGSTMSNGVLNPAVALGIGSFNSIYALGPIIGAIVAAMLVEWMHD